MSYNESSEANSIFNVIYSSFFSYCGDTGLDVETWTGISKNKSDNQMKKQIAILLSTLGLTTAANANPVYECSLLDEGKPYAQMIKYENKFVEIFTTGEVEEFFCTVLPFNYTENSVCISRKDGYQKKGYIYTLVTIDMENEFPISLTYNSITDDKENWKNPISQRTEVKNCKAF